MLDLEPFFRPLTINALTLPNRFVMPAMQRAWSGPDGELMDKSIEYYRLRAQGGTGLLIGESLGIDHPSTTMSVGELHLTPTTRESWARCVDAVKGEGGSFLLQLWHPGAGRPAGHGPHPDVASLSPSGLYGDKAVGRAASLQDLADLKAAYVEAALTARDIGADGIEFHMAHGYLLYQFLSPQTNVREDHYGGAEMADRVRFPAEVVAAVREALGPRFVIGCRFSQWAAWDYDAMVARTPAELRTLVTALDAAGADMFHTSTRYFHKPQWSDSPLPLSAWVKTMTDLPVVTVGSVGLDVDFMQSVFAEADANSALDTSLADLLARFDRDEFDLIAVGRAIIGDPEFVNKLRDGRIDEIRQFSRADLADLDVDPEALHESVGQRARQAASS